MAYKLKLKRINNQIKDTKDRLLKLEIKKQEIEKIKYLERK